MEPNKFNFTDQEFLNVINLLCKLDADEEEYIPITSIDAKVNMDQLDSLSIMIFFTLVNAIFLWCVPLTLSFGLTTHQLIINLIGSLIGVGVAEAGMLEFTDKGKFTVRTIKEFVTSKATQTYSYSEAQKYINKGNYFGGQLE